LGRARERPGRGRLVCGVLSAGVFPAMAHDPLHVLWIEPSFPGRLGGIADWLTRRRGYRSFFYCHTTAPQAHWPASVGRGLDVVTFPVGGAARDPAVAWTRTLERGLCYAYACHEVLEQRRPRPIDLVVGRSAGLGSSLFAPVTYPAVPVVSWLDYYYQPHAHDLADETPPNTPESYYLWRRSMGVIDLLDLEQAALALTPTRWQRSLYPAAYQGDIEVFPDGVETQLFRVPSWRGRRSGVRRIADRTIPQGVRVVSYVGRFLERLRGFDRFLRLAAALHQAQPDVICVAVGDRIVRRGLDVASFNQDYAGQILPTIAGLDPERLWLLGTVEPRVTAEVFAASDLHVAAGRAYPVARSLLEAMACGCVVLASDVEPHRELVHSGRNGILVDGRDDSAWRAFALRILADPAAFLPLGQAAAEDVRDQFARSVCLPRLAERFSQLVGGQE